MTGPKWMVIANPKAGKNKVLEEWTLIDRALREAGVEFDALFSKSKYHSIELTVRAIRDGYRHIVAVGGDGTIHEVVNGIFFQKEVSPSEITLAVIPAGSGNDWVKMYGIPHDYVKCAEIIAACNIKKQDICRVDVVESKVPQTRYMINGCGVGLDAAICRECNAMKQKGKSGSLIYVKAAARSFFKMKPNLFEIEVDGKKFFSGEALSVALANGIYSGGGMIQAPDAIMDDGLVNVTVIGAMSKPMILVRFKELFSGRIYQVPNIFHITGKHVKVNVLQTDQPVEVDGEVVGSTPLELTVLPQALSIVAE